MGKQNKVDDLMMDIMESAEESIKGNAVRAAKKDKLMKLNKETGILDKLLAVMTPEEKEFMRAGNLEALVKSLERRSNERN